MPGAIGREAAVFPFGDIPLLLDKGFALGLLRPLVWLSVASLAPSGAANRHTFGGLNDQAFKMIPLLEERVSATWPF